MHESKRERYIRILTDKGGADISAEACKELVELLKEADRPTGEWTKAVKDGVISFSDAFAECDQCHKVTFNGWRMNYCPNCGSYNGGGKDDA